MSIIRSIMIGDVCGPNALRALSMNLEAIKKEYRADLVVVNAENEDDGFGLSINGAKELFKAGVDVITSGNHIWENKDLVENMDKFEYLLRPANYAGKIPGFGYCVLNTKKEDVVIVNLQGREHMPITDSPFTTLKKLIPTLKSKSKTILVDFHAESSREKEALAYYNAANITALVGTHTHVQTADERIIDNHCAYITDLGFTGATNSIIGSDIKISIKKQATQMPLRTILAQGQIEINGVVIESEDGRALSIKRFRFYEKDIYS